MPVYERCIKLVQLSLTLYADWTANPELDEPDKTFLIVSLDLLSGLTQGLRANMAVLITQSQASSDSLPMMIQLLQACLNVRVPLPPIALACQLTSLLYGQHPEASVRQSGYALLGDMAINCQALSVYLPAFLPRIVKEIADQVAAPKYEEVSVCNNAAWAVGEIAMQCQPSAGGHAILPTVVRLSR